VDDPPRDPGLSGVAGFGLRRRVEEHLGSEVVRARDSERAKRPFLSPLFRTRLRARTGFPGVVAGRSSTTRARSAPPPRTSGSPSARAELVERSDALPVAAGLSAASRPGNACGSERLRVVGPGLGVVQPLHFRLEAGDLPTGRRPGSSRDERARTDDLGEEIDRRTDGGKDEDHPEPGRRLAAADALDRHPESEGGPQNVSHRSRARFVWGSDRFSNAPPGAGAAPT
jgi:hypothetical protein